MWAFTKTQIPWSTPGISIFNLFKYLLRNVPLQMSYYATVCKTINLFFWPLHPTISKHVFGQFSICTYFVCARVYFSYRPRSAHVMYVSNTHIHIHIHIAAALLWIIIIIILELGFVGIKWQKGDNSAICLLLRMVKSYIMLGGVSSVLTTLFT